jgi:uncharacterized protein (UPF0303 family)
LQDKKCMGWLIYYIIYILFSVYNMLVFRNSYNGVTRERNKNITRKIVVVKYYMNGKSLSESSIKSVKRLLNTIVL